LTRWHQLEVASLLHKAEIHVALRDRSSTTAGGTGVGSCDAAGTALKKVIPGDGICQNPEYVLQ